MTPSEKDRLEDLIYEVRKELEDDLAGAEIHFVDNIDEDPESWQGADRNAVISRYIKYLT